MSDLENVFEAQRLKDQKGWTVVAPFLGNDGHLYKTELVLARASEHEARRIAKALNAAYELGKLTAIQRIAKGLQVDRRRIKRLAI